MTRARFLQTVGAELAMNRPALAVLLLGLATRAHAGPRMEIAVSEGVLHDLPRGDARRNLAFDRARELGATHLRATLIWESRANDVYDDAYFARWDSFVHEAVARGFEVQLTLTGIASAGYGGPNRTGVNPDPARYARFVDACARRYKGKVRRYSIWNEPNYLVFLCVAPDAVLQRMRDLSKIANDKSRPETQRKSASSQHKALVEHEVMPRTAARYRELFDRGSKAVRAVDPAAAVLAFELSQKDAYRWLDLALPKGRTLVADGFALHPYQFVIAPDDPRMKTAQSAGISRLDLVQATLARFAKERRLVTRQGGAVPLLLTEFGYMKREDRGGVTLPQQLPEATRAAWLPKAFEVARRSGARQMLYFNIWPTQAGYVWDTSLLDRQGNPLPCFVTLRSWARANGY